MALDFRARDAVFAAAEDGVFDLLVIGAGITGCGIARDAALRGLRVALVDAGDLAAGTSSRSSKLIHGGLRYLGDAHTALVEEAVRERSVLSTIAPHLARPIDMVIPLRSEAALTRLRDRLSRYEAVSTERPFVPHRTWSREDLAAAEPTVASDRFVAAVLVSELMTDDARLTIANARGAADAGAAVATYATVTRILTENGKACGAEICGALANEQRRARVRARLVVNAAGPWVDMVRRFEDSTAAKLLTLSKGVHVVVRRSRLPLARAVVSYAKDGGVVTTIPRGSYVYVGPTQTEVASPSYEPGVDASDVTLALEPLASTFHTPIDARDIVAAWSGIRPLLSHPAETLAALPRAYELSEGPSGVLTVAGGKLTVYRAMAERAVDRCVERLKVSARACSTAQTPLPGGDCLDRLDAMRLQLETLGQSAPVAERAARLYGAEAADVFATDAGPAAEVTHAVLHEGALTLEDYWVRRSGRCWFDEHEPGASSSIEVASARMRELLGWSQAETRRQLELCRAPMFSI